MKINSFEIVNVLVVACLFLVLKRRTDVASLLLALFTYGTLHFSFAALALATHESGSVLIALHNEGGGLLAKLSALSLLVVVFVMLSKHAYKAFLLNQDVEKKLALHFLLAMGVLCCGYVLNIRLGDWLQLKNVISVEILLAVLLMGYFGLLGAPALKSAEIYPWILGGMLILAVADCIAFYEVFGHHSWAVFMTSSGALIYRASSILFNPNVLGFWASLVYLGYAYGMHEYKDHRKMMFWGMVLASIAIYLSGSRSTGYLLLGLLIFPVLLMKERLRWVTLMVLPLTMLTIYAVAAWLVVPFVPSNEGWREVALLGERFSAAPLYLVSYISMLAGLPASVPVEVAVSVEGRYMGDGRDSGWLVLYDDAGWLGTLAMLWVYFMLFLYGLRAYMASHNAASVYALMALCYCLLVGLVMRFQIFPLWLFISLILMPSMIYWGRISASNSFRQVVNARTDS